MYIIYSIYAHKYIYINICKYNIYINLGLQGMHSLRGTGWHGGTQCYGTPDTVYTLHHEDQSYAYSMFVKTWNTIKISLSFGKPDVMFLDTGSRSNSDVKQRE